jgi:hypothetical protein
MSDADSNLLKGSLLYREYLAERSAILEHKWYMSEKAKHDVGFEKALLDWVLKHRTKWRSERKARTAGRTGMK